MKRFLRSLMGSKVKVMRVQVRECFNGGGIQFDGVASRLSCTKMAWTWPVFFGDQSQDKSDGVTDRVKLRTGHIRDDFVDGSFQFPDSPLHW